MAEPPKSAEEPKPEPQVPSVKNEWADKLAQQAAAKLANRGSIKSSLLAGPPAADSNGPPAPEPHSNGNVNGAGTFVKPAHPFDRPRLNLQPRSQPLPSAPPAADRAGSGQLSERTDSGSLAGEERPRLKLQPRSLPMPSDAARSQENGGRPKLNLLPRNKPAGMHTHVYHLRVAGCQLYVVLLLTG